MSSPRWDRAAELVDAIIQAQPESAISPQTHLQLLRRSLRTGDGLCQQNPPVAGLTDEACKRFRQALARLRVHILEQPPTGHSTEDVANFPEAPNDSSKAE